MAENPRPQNNDNNELLPMDSHLLSDRSSVFRHADPYAVSDYVNQHVGQHFIGLSRTTHPQPQPSPSGKELR